MFNPLRFDTLIHMRQFGCHIIPAPFVHDSPNLQLEPSYEGGSISSQCFKEPLVSRLGLILCIEK